MKAVFKKTNSILFAVFLALLIIWSGLCVFMLLKNNLTGATNILICLLVAIIICAFGMIPFLYNYKAYLHIDNNKIVGRFGFFKRLECDMADVTFVLPRFDTMHILLQDRKYYIMGIKNAYEVGAFMMQNIPFSPCENKQDVIANVKKRQQNIKKYSVFVFCAIGLSFLWVLITVFLTGARDLPQFNPSDWIIFSMMCFLEVLTVSAMFTFAIKARQGNPVKLEEQIYKIKRSAIETAPLLAVSGRIQSVFADPFFSQRITVCLNIIEDNDEAFLYYTEIFDEDFKLKFAYQSRIFEDAEMYEMFRGCLDITEKFM